MSCPSANKAKGRINRPSLHSIGLVKGLVAAAATIAASAAIAASAEAITTAAAQDKDKDDNPATTAISSETTTTITHNQVTSFFVLQHILCHPAKLCYNKIEKRYLKKTGKNNSIYQQYRGELK